MVTESMSVVRRAASTIALKASLRKQAYSNILKIVPKKKWKFSDKYSDFFLFLLKT